MSASPFCCRGCPFPGRPASLLLTGCPRLRFSPQPVCPCTGSHIIAVAHFLLPGSTGFSVTSVTSPGLTPCPIAPSPASRCLTPAMCVALSVWWPCPGPHVTCAACAARTVISSCAVGSALNGRQSARGCCPSFDLLCPRPGCASHPASSLSGCGAPAPGSATRPPLALCVGGLGLRDCPPPASGNSACLTCLLPALSSWSLVHTG